MKVSRVPGQSAISLLLLLVVAAAALAACGRTSTTTSTSPGAREESPSATPLPMATGPGTVAFTEDTLSGSSEVDSRGICIVRRDGTGLRQPAGSGSSHPAWSPEGSKIAYRMGMRGVFVMNANNPEQRLVALADQRVGIAESLEPYGQVSASSSATPDGPTSAD